MNFKDIRLHIFILLEKNSNKSYINQIYLSDYLGSGYYMFKSEIWNIYFKVREIQDFKILKYERG